MKTILLVEDEQMLREAYQYLLTDYGYRVVTKSDGQQALDYLNHHQAPDLILLDLLMPHMSGVEFLRATDVRQAYPTTVVIVFSNLSSPAKTSELLELGASKHVVKAELGPSDLLQLVQSELSARESAGHEPQPKPYFRHAHA